MARKKPSVIWVVLAYLIPLLLLCALGSLVLVVLSEEPAPGTRCYSLGEQVVRKQDGIRLECGRNVSTGNLFWHVIAEKRK